MKYLVTGGAGFIGSHLVRSLIESGHRVRVFDDFSTGKPENIAGLDLELMEGDVRDVEQVGRAVKGMDYVIHLAALASVSRSVKAPLASHSVNATGTLAVLQASKERGVKRVVFAGSSSAYGNSEKLPKREDAVPAPASPYAVSKVAGEYYCRMYSATMGLEAACVRYFNVFGPRQDPDSEYAAVIPKFIEAALHGEEPVVHGDGKQSRDFTYVANAVDATLRATTAKEAPGEIFNVACGERRSLLDLLGEIESLLDVRLTPLFGDPRPGDVRHSLADIEKSKRLLGYVPRIGFTDGLQRTLEWFRSRQAVDEAGDTAARGQGRRSAR
ncbi:MAG: SDR family oxidoreductase [Gammaproteobacteria bacterium]|nr:SDR family oxidoreductase [Gammaproteobacteria bacterium]